MSQAWSFLIGVALATGVAVLIAAVRYRGALRLVEELIRGLRALEQGRPVRPVSVGITGLWGRLGRAFDVIAPRLETRMAQLEQEHQQLRAVLEGMAEGVIAIDSARRLRYANARAERLLNLRSAAVGRLVPELIRSPSVQEAVDATLATASPYRGEITLNAFDPDTRVRSRVLAVHGARLPGPPPGAVLVFHDVTELRRLERMRQDFVANASHELKTPLAAIKAYTETLLDWALHDEKVNQRFLHQIDEQSDRLDQLIQDMLSLARIESDQDTFHHQPLLLVAVARQRVRMHQDRALAKNLTLELVAEPDAEQALVVVDEEALRQILDNLIDNALKYTLDNGGFVRVTCSTTDDQQVVVEVADSGIGIARDELPRIFERFYRVDKARSRAVGGTGLGLSIVKNLVNSLGGVIDVTSRVGAGTRFVVKLPRSSPEESGKIVANFKAHTKPS